MCQAKGRVSGRARRGRQQQEQRARRQQRTIQRRQPRWASAMRGAMGAAPKRVARSSPCARARAFGARPFGVVKTPLSRVAHSSGELRGRSRQENRRRGSRCVVAACVLGWWSKPHSGGKEAMHMSCFVKVKASRRTAKGFCVRRLQPRQKFCRKTCSASASEPQGTT